MHLIQARAGRWQTVRGMGKVQCICRGFRCQKLTTFPRLVDGEWSDDDIVDPLSQIINFLSDKRDKALSQRWGLWLTKRDPDRGLKVPSLCLNPHIMLTHGVSDCAASDAARGGKAP